MPLQTLAHYEILATQAQGHLSAGPILGLRLAIHGLQRAADAIAVVTGYRLAARGNNRVASAAGARTRSSDDRNAGHFRGAATKLLPGAAATLWAAAIWPDSFVARRRRWTRIDSSSRRALGPNRGYAMPRDYYRGLTGKRTLLRGKVAATFCELAAERAVRVLAREFSIQLAREKYPLMEQKNLQQMLAPYDDLSSHQWVNVRIGARDLPGYRAAGVNCAACGEAVNFQRHVENGGRAPCRACAGENCYRAR